MAKPATISKGQSHHNSKTSRTTETVTQKSSNKGPVTFDKKPKSANKTANATTNATTNATANRQPVKNNISNTTNKTEWQKLYEFMTKYVIKEKKGQGLPITHTLTYYPCGKFNIPEDARPRFLKLYEDTILAGFEPHITEMHKDIGPIIIDLDMCQSQKHSKRYYTPATIRNVIKLYNTVIKKYLDVNSSSIVAFVSEKREPTLRKGEYHDGIHIVYPFICTTPALQLLMREEFLKLAKANKIFKIIPLTNSLDSVFDKNVIRKTPWMLYGSEKISTIVSILCNTHILFN